MLIDASEAEERSNANDTGLFLGLWPGDVRLRTGQVNVRGLLRRTTTV